MSRELLLALDLGTTGVRALLVGPEGRVRSRAYRPMGTSYPRPGWVEQDPGEMWERSLEVMREVLEGTQTPASSLAGLGVVTQRATAVAWDVRSGEPLGAAISWQDQRTVERVAGFRAMGLPLNTLATATKLEWWMAHDPLIQKAASTGTLRLGTPDSWLTAKLTGGAAHVTDPGQASCTALYDTAKGAWADPLLELFGVPAGTLPRVVATSEVVGETPADLLGASVPVAARAGDQQSAAFAQGVHAAGEAKLTLGTSGMLDLHTGASPADPPPGSYPLALWTLLDGTRAFCLEGTVITAGAALEWGVNLGLAPDVATLERRAREVPDTGGVRFVPALQGLGTPFLDDRATGLLGGMTRGTGVPEIARAIIEGVAQRSVDVCEALAIGPGPLRVDGGLARSDLLLQAIADLGAREVLRAAEAETTALGAAYLAGLATGVFARPEVCREALAPGVCFRPRWDADRRGAERAAWSRVLEKARGEAP